MDEDKALNAIRLVTYDDELGFTSLMDKIISECTKWKDRYQELVRLRREPGVLKMIIDSNVGKTVCGNDIKYDGVYRSGTDERIIGYEGIILVQDMQNGNTHIIDGGNEGYMFQVDIPMPQGIHNGMSLIPCGDGYLLSMVCGDKRYIVDSNQDLYITNSHIKLIDRNGNTHCSVSHRGISRVVSSWLSG